MVYIRFISQTHGPATAGNPRSPPPPSRPLATALAARASPLGAHPLQLRQECREARGDTAL